MKNNYYRLILNKLNIFSFLTYFKTKLINIVELSLLKIEMIKTIDHIALIKKWEIPEVLKNANTIILGSFNPYNPEKENTDYYYGRNSNFLWKTIASIIGKNEDFFQDNFDRKYEVMVDLKFGFMDIIDSIEISGNNSDELDEYIRQNIFTNFLDQKIFTSKTKFNETVIRLKRNYNHRINDVIKSNCVTKIIHTMGNSRISLDLKTTPKESNLGKNGFQYLINSISSHHIEFDFTSYSPSGYATRKGGNEYPKILKNWLTKNLSV